jgi:hypothetical protein
MTWARRTVSSTASDALAPNQREDLVVRCAASSQQVILSPCAVPPEGAYDGLHSSINSITLKDERLAGKILGGLMVLTLGCQGGFNLAGTWYGDLYVVYREQLMSYPRPILVTVDGNSAHLRPFCPDGTGSLLATVSGSVAIVSGSLACKATSIGSCPSVVLTYTNTTADLIVPMPPDDPFLSIAATGTASGCELEGPFTANFRGDSS